MKESLFFMLVVFSTWLVIVLVGEFIRNIL